jgi:hypothetical protein
MGVRYFNADTNSNLTRPTGFVFPVGLSVAAAALSTIDYLVVAGGGGSSNFGAGGAGGFRTSTGYSVTGGTSYSITVGAGGSSSPRQGSNSGFFIVFNSPVVNNFFSSISVNALLISPSIIN